jgi:hypothetical protein
MPFPIRGNFVIEVLGQYSKAKMSPQMLSKGIKWAVFLGG